MNVTKKIPSLKSGFCGSIVGYFFVRIDFVSSIQGGKTVRALLKSNQILQKLLKSMPKPSRRYVHESIPTKAIVKSHLVLVLLRMY